MKNRPLFVFTLTSLGLMGCLPKQDDAAPRLAVTFPAAYVVNGTSSTLSIINRQTGELESTLPLTDRNALSGQYLLYPHHVYLNPAGTQLAVAAPGVDLSGGHETDAHGGGHKGNPQGKVALIDARTGLVQRVVSLPAANHNVLFSPDGTELWTTQTTDPGSLLVYDAATLRLKATIGVGKEPAEVTFSSDGKRAFVANGGSASVTVIDPVLKTVVATVAVGKNPVGAWPGTDGRLYVDNESGRSISVLDGKTLRVVQTLDLGFLPGYAAYHAGRAELWVTDPDAGKVHWFTAPANGQLTPAGSLATGPGAHAIDFDATTAYVTNQEGASVSVVDVATHRKLKDIPVGQKPNGVVLSR